MSVLQYFFFHEFMTLVIKCILKSFVEVNHFSFYSICCPERNFPVPEGFLSMTQMRTQRSLRCGLPIKLPLMWQNRSSVMCKRIVLCDAFKLCLSFWNCKNVTCKIWSSQIFITHGFKRYQEGIFPLLFAIHQSSGL